MQTTTIKRITTLGIAAALAACGGSEGDDNVMNTGGRVGLTSLPDSVACDTTKAKPLCTLTAGEYTQDMVWDEGNEFLMPDGNVFIASGAKLTIQPGTTIYGAGSTALVVRPGAQIIADGTAAKPIVFTSAKEEGERSRGDWGGLIINGNAPVNCAATPGGTCEGEGNSGAYGGTSATDSSGTLRYVRVEFAGSRITDEDEYNGVAFQGVGSGTIVENLHVHLASDDGIEFFGGSVNLKHAVITGAGDDSLDWTFGYNGNIQFVLVQQHEDEANQGIEADSNKDNPDIDPRSNPTISNITLIGADAPDGQTGMLLRRGTNITLTNAIFSNFEKCFDVDDAATFALRNEMRISNSIFDCTTTWDEQMDDPWLISDYVMSEQSGNSIEGPMLFAPTNRTTPGFAPMSGSPAMSGGQAPSGSFFTAADFKGGVDPADDWTQGWTAYPAN